MFYNSLILDSVNTTEITWNVEPVPVEGDCMFIDKNGTWRSQACNETEQAFICESGTLCLYSVCISAKGKAEQILCYDNPSECRCAL